jgi:hypothetical protein
MMRVLMRNQEVGSDPGWKLGCSQFLVEQPKPPEWWSPYSHVDKGFKQNLEPEAAMSHRKTGCWNIIEQASSGLVSRCIPHS